MACNETYRKKKKTKNFLQKMQSMYHDEDIPLLFAYIVAMFCDWCGVVSNLFKALHAHRHAQNICIGAVTSQMGK